ncbi:MAG: hypothetical protein HC905_13850 [Bacteroidales bacterium]|nr:hypothetical protein [Bacteroidales bacterium]
MVLFSDPKEYYDATIKILSGEIKIDLFNIYHPRLIFYSLPLFKFFPNTLLTLKIFNLIIFLITALGYTYILRKLYNKNSSILFIFIFLSYPTYYYVINLFSHDLMGNFYNLLFIICLFQIDTIISKETNYIRYSILIVLSGLILFILEMQRSIAPVVILTMMLSIIFKLRNNISKIRNTFIITFLQLLLFFTGLIKLPIQIFHLRKAIIRFTAMLAGFTHIII